MYTETTFCELCKNNSSWFAAWVRPGIIWSLICVFPIFIAYGRIAWDHEDSYWHSRDITGPWPVFCDIVKPTHFWRGKKTLRQTPLPRWNQVRRGNRRHEFGAPKSHGLVGVFGCFKSNLCFFLASQRKKHQEIQEDRNPFKWMGEITCNYICQPSILQVFFYQMFVHYHWSLENCLVIIPNIDSFGTACWSYLRLFSDQSIVDGLTPKKHSQERKQWRYKTFHGIICFPFQLC